MSNETNNRLVRLFKRPDFDRVLDVLTPKQREFMQHRREKWQADGVLSDDVIPSYALAHGLGRQAPWHLQKKALHRIVHISHVKEGRKI
jgi:hypothetical protein